MLDYNGIKVKMTENKVTQKELCQRTGIREATLSRMCNGKTTRIPADILEALCIFLHCQPGDLIKYVPDSTV